VRGPGRTSCSYTVTDVGLLLQKLVLGRNAVNISTPLEQGRI
jgi:hypothetical protein